jgi:glutamate N-acetyltransferase/amino-acid N-acetyltransferase
VKWDQEIVKSQNEVHAIIANSGVANACTGAEGLGYCRETAEKAAELLGIPAESVILGSTGVIGRQLPMDKLAHGVELLVEAKNDSEENGTKAAQAIMTTDLVKKELAVQFEVEGVTVTVGGMAKGSGMIHPDMCTMLSFVTTDAVISKDALQKALSADVNDTYNMISVDRDTSTNDTCVVIANGAAGNKEITAEGEAFEAFCKALHEVNEYLAKQIAGDGEGCTALFEVKVINADTVENAKVIAKSVVTSNLTKTAIAGHDANWGRILCAMGYSGAQFDPEQVDLFFESAAGKIQIIENGTAVDYSEDKATEILSEKVVTAIADVKTGEASATAWGCDLTYDYIKINADYRS